MIEATYKLYCDCCGVKVSEQRATGRVATALALPVDVGTRIDNVLWCDACFAGPKREMQDRIRQQQTPSLEQIARRREEAARNKS